MIPKGELPAVDSGRALSRADAAPLPLFPRRFRTRVFSYILGLALATSAGAVFLYYTRQLGFIEKDRGRRAKTLLTSLATQAELGAYAGDAALCDLAARRTFGEDDVLLVAIYDRRGREIIRFADPALSPPPLSPLVLARLGANPDARPERHELADASGERHDDLYAPIVTALRDPDEILSAGPGGRTWRREVVGIARVGLSRRPARAQLQEVVRWGFVLAAGLLAVGVAAALLIARRISRPIAALTHGADEIRDGKLDTRVAVETKDELGQLAYSFNRMAARLQESLLALETLNRDLEVEVSRRTAEIARAAQFSTLLNAPMDPPEAGDDPSRPLVMPPPATEISGGEAQGNLGRLLDHAIAALVSGTAARAGAVLLSREESVDFELEMARHRGAPAPEFAPLPAQAALHSGDLIVEEERLVIPLMLGSEPEGCVMLLAPTAPREEVLRLARHAAPQLAIAVGNARAYAAAAHLARELEGRNVALRKQRDQLQEMNRLKSEFLANVSHELRTPLNAIIGYAELISDGLYGEVNRDQTRALSGIDESGRNLLTLINQILDLSKIEAGRMTVHLEPVDPVAISEAVLAEAAPLAKDRPYQVELTVEAPAAGWCIVSDGPKVKQIITNLVSNAIKFTPEGSVRVRIRAEPSGGCRIAVSDTGIGIRPEDMKIIFEEFRQVDGSSTRAFGGTGLGLAIAKRFAELLGGEVTVESTVGAGSTFTLSLPREAPLPTARRQTVPIPPPVPVDAIREAKAR